MYLRLTCIKIMLFSNNKELFFLYRYTINTILIFFYTYGNVICLAVLLQSASLLLYPLVLGSPLARTHCGPKSASYSWASCRLGWAYVAAIASTVLAGYCPLLAYFSHHNRFKPCLWTEIWRLEINGKFNFLQFDSKIIVVNTNTNSILNSFSISSHHFTNARTCICLGGEKT